MNIDNIDSSLLKTALDKINISICIVDKNCMVKYWNVAAEKFYKILKKEIVGKHVTKFFPKALLPKVIKEQKAYEDVYNNPKEDYYIVISAVPLYDHEDNIIGGISIDKDITNYIKTETILEKTKDNIKLLEEEINAINHSKYSFSKIIGTNDSFKKVLKLCKDISYSNISVLLLGESGTGKEVVARAIHTESKRKGPFIPLNCSAIPRDLLESELFGYEGGAFTGAQRKGKIGKIEAADRGTLFLDEIGDMPLDMQPKLLRVLETNIVNRLGSNKDVKVDVRIIGATNKNLKEAVRKGLFRQDLYYRLNSVVIELPSLKERKDDIELLTNYFIETFCMEYGLNIPVLSKEFLNGLINYEWEGNIRELKNVIERVIILQKKDLGNVINTSFLPEYILNSKNIIHNKKNTITNLNLKNKIEETEKETIIQALTISRGNITNATKLLNIPRTSLYYKLKKYNIVLETRITE
ncbi:MAG: sigma 54-interacting transcriptional regulator [Dethiosulfatibacter sp.]|nr:sigma 54-interacting transcriptional regulator [Dethiosulfatibacter sp.]